MPISLFSSPFGSLDLALMAGSPEAKDWLADLQGTEAPKWIWVVPSSRRRRAIVRNWPGAESGRSALLPRIVTLDGLVNLVATTQGIVVKKITSMERRQRVLKAWQKTLPNLASGKGTAAHMDQLIRVWQDNKVTPRDGITKQFHENYQAGLRATDSVDRHGWLGMIAAHLAKKPFNTMAFAAVGVVLDGFHLFSLPELDFIKVLGNSMNLKLWVPCSPDGIEGELLSFIAGYLKIPWQNTKPLSFAPIEITRIDCQDRQSEVREVVHRIRLKLNRKDGHKPHEIAVVLPGQDYDPLIRQAFSDAGITINLAGRSRSLLSSGPGRLIQAAIQRIEGTPTVRSFMDFLRQPILRRQIRVERVDELSWLEASLLHVNLGHSFSGWKKVLDQLGESISQSRTSRTEENEPLSEEEVQKFEDIKGRRKGLLVLVERLHEQLAELAQPSDSISKTVENLSNYLNHIQLERWLSPGAKTCEAVDLAVMQADQLAWLKIRTVLGDLAGVPDAVLPSNRSGRRDHLNLISMILETENYQIKTEDDEGVQVMEIRETRGIRFEDIHVLGLQSGAYDSVTEEEALRDLLTEEKQAKARTRQEARQVFFQLGLSGAKSLNYYRPKSLNEENLLPSVWIEDIPPKEAHSVPLLGVGMSQIQILTGHAAPLAMDTSPKVTSPKEIIGDAKAMTLVHGLALQRGELKSWWAHIQAPTINDWALDRISLRSKPETPLSPSRIESYARCPFQYFAEKMLYLKKKDADESALHQGGLIHLVFQRFMEEWRTKNGAKPGQPVDLPGERTGSREDLLRIWQETLSSDPRAGSLDRKVRAKVTRPGGVIDIYLANLERFRDAGVRHVAAEENIGPANLGDSEAPLFLQGRIDDWYVWQDGKSTLVDYKSGTTPPPGKFLKERDRKWKVQLDLYAAVLLATDIEVKQGMYLFLEMNSKWEEEDKVQSHTVLQGHFIKEWLPLRRKDCPPLDKEGAVTHAKGVARSIRNGIIPLTTFQNPKDHPACTNNCPVRNICRTPAVIRPNFH